MNPCLRFVSLHWRARGYIFTAICNCCFQEIHMSNRTNTLGQIGRAEFLKLAGGFAALSGSKVSAKAQSPAATLDQATAALGSNLGSLFPSNIIFTFDYNSAAPHQVTLPQPLSDFASWYSFASNLIGSGAPNGVYGRIVKGTDQTTGNTISINVDKNQVDVTGPNGNPITGAALSSLQPWARSPDTLGGTPLGGAWRLWVQDDYQAPGYSDTRIQIVPGPFLTAAAAYTAGTAAQGAVSEFTVAAAFNDAGTVLGVVQGGAPNANIRTKPSASVSNAAEWTPVRDGALLQPAYRMSAPEGLVVRG
jgi:hypothetical protein